MDEKDTKALRLFIVKALIVLALAGAVAVIVLKIDIISSGIASICTILNPFIYGLVLAYLKNPLYNKMISITKTKEKEHRTISLIITEVLTLMFVIALGVLVVPKIIDSIVRIVDAFPSILDNIQKTVNELLEKNKTFKSMYGEQLKDIKGVLITYSQDSLIPALNTYSDVITGYVKNVGVVIVNVILAFIVSILVLANKDTLKAKVIDILTIIAKPKLCKVILDEAKIADKMFAGFFVGKLIDSLIIGIIAFIACLIMKMPYASAIAAIIGLTNIIPMVGPFIGAVPSILLVLSIDPIKAIWLTLFIIVLQQVDGNIIGPKLIGNSTGVDSLAVLFAIALFGGIWGLVGMVVGVPLYAVLADIFNKVLNNIKEKRLCKEEQSNGE